jgi:mRNA interferase MazF
MGGFVKGDVVVIPFPFSDLSHSKRRPALVIAAPVGDDLILCAISSQARKDDPLAVEIAPSDFSAGSLKKVSHVRCDHFFTGDSNIVEYKVGTLSQSKTDAVIARIVKMLTGA